MCDTLAVLGLVALAAAAAGIDYAFGRRARRRRPVVMMARPLTSYERWAQRHRRGWWGSWRD